LPPDLEEFLGAPGFRDPGAAHDRLHDLFRDPGEMLALARLSGYLRDLVGGCPDPDAALLQLARFVEVRGGRLALYQRFLDHPALLDRFVHVVASSHYLADILVRYPDTLHLLGEAPLLARPRPCPELRDELRRLCEPYPSEAEKLDALRRFHRREVLRIGAADLLGFLDLGGIARQISDLADAFLAQCLSIVAEKLDRAGGLIVLALGKLGGQELNYSSDIDLFFLTRRPDRLAKASEAARRLVAALGETTSEGVVYRVDLRLRPYGSEGELVTTPEKFEEYLRRKAHPAERQAMLKARAVAGDVAAGRRFLRRVRATLFADSRSARQEVRKLKARIEQQLHERGQAEGHLKLAPGGIRDIEFLVQALQLEAGDRRPEVQTSNTLEALARLEEAALLASDDAASLREAYVFLRTVEHRMQLMGNQQVYRLPRKEEDLRRLGRTLGFRDPGPADALLDAYDARSRKVRAIFDRVLGRGGADRSPAAPASPSLDLVARQLGPAAERMDVRVIAEGAGLLDQVRRPEDVRVQARQNEPDRWTVLVGAVAQAGLLPRVAGLFAARGVNIRSGDFLQLRSDESRRPRKALGVFEVTTPRPLPPDFWDAYAGRLAALTRLAAAGKEEAAQDQVVEDVGEAFRAAARREGPLLPVRIEVRNDPSARDTELHIHSADTLGFLFEFTAALAALRVEVSRAVIRTLDDEVYDTFGVTDPHGRKITAGRALDELRTAAAIVKQFMHLLPRSPNPAQALRQFTALLRQTFSRGGGLREARTLESPTVLSAIADLMGVSRFLWEDFLLLQHENLFPILCNVPALDRRKGRAQRRRELDRWTARSQDPFDAVNEFKDREMFREELRHITRRSGFHDFTASMSDLARVVIEKVAQLSYEEARRRFGDPRRPDGRPCPWAVAGLGKLGGGELGFASDLELLFVYEGEGTTAGADAPSNALFFMELVKRFLQGLRARREGSFDVDLRLRPHGDAGPLASSLEGFRAYYSEAGPARPFERLALVKLSPVAGDPELGARLREARDAFVYSGRPVDYENLLHLRKRQAAELVGPGEISAKYSPGGLVDVEYFVQARQIQAGHRDLHVRVPDTRRALSRLVKGGHLRPELGFELSETYVFLRRLIDALRVVRGNAKDVKIPAAGGREFGYLVRRLEYSSAAHLEAEIRQRMTFARNVWSERRFS
jgi:glutamate-ammonia-ligase adenylyltransferase